MSGPMLLGNWCSYIWLNEDFFFTLNGISLMITQLLSSWISFDQTLKADSINKLISFIIIDKIWYGFTSSVSKVR